MNYEIRKEFEVWADSIGLCQVDLIIDLERYMDGNVELAWQSWQASREAMKPVKFPSEIDIDLIGDQVANSHANSYAEGYNDALSDLELKITELGYKVSE